MIRDKTLTHIAGVELSETNSSSAVQIPFTLPITSEDDEDSNEKDEEEESLDAGDKNAQNEDTSYVQQPCNKRRPDVAELKNRSSSSSSACNNQDQPLLAAIPNKKPKMTFSKTSGHKTVVNHFYF